jgi:hypothetical protein
MILGELVTPRDPIHWYPKTEEDLFDFEKDNMKIVVAKWRLIRKSRKESWVCPACMKMVVDLESK